MGLQIDELLQRDVTVELRRCTACVARYLLSCFGSVGGNI
jgi:hypothetical protein